jgi:hypothetical protein
MILMFGVGLVTLYISFSLLALIVFPMLWVADNSTDLPWITMGLFCAPFVISLGLVGPYYIYHQCVHGEWGDRCCYYFPCCCPLYHQRQI